MIFEEDKKHNKKRAILSEEEKKRVADILEELKTIYGAKDITIRKRNIYYDESSNIDYIIDIKEANVGKGWE